MKRFCVAAVCLLAFSLSSRAASIITINNPSFETSTLDCAAGPSCFYGVITGWNGIGSLTQATFRPSVGPGLEFNALPDGSEVAAVSNGSGSGGEMYQDLSATLAADTTYTLTFWVGQRRDVSFDSSYVVSLLANGVVLASGTELRPRPVSLWSRRSSSAAAQRPLNWATP